MEIESIIVQADYCFGEKPLRLNDLKKVNFIFAPNGAGKSTISNMLAQQPADVTMRATWEVAATDLPIRVFNEAYRSRVLTERVNGIFTIGDKSAEINDQITTLEDENRGREKNRDTWQTSIGSDSSPNDTHGLLGQIESARLAARSLVFSAHKDIDESVLPIVFAGFRGNQDKFFEEACGRFGKSESSDSNAGWKAIKTRARTLSGDKKKRSRLPAIKTQSLIPPEDVAEVGSKSPHGGGGEFAKLIQHLHNEDWVSKGRDYIGRALGKCPFCQNQAPVDLESELAKYFEGGFDAALERSTRIASEVKICAETLEVEISAVEAAISGQSDLDEEQFSTSISHVREAARLLSSQLRERSAHPTSPFDVSDVNIVVAELSELVTAENERIDQHNQIVENFVAERKKLVDDGWSAFLSGTAVSIELKRFKGIESKKKQAIADLRTKIAESEQQDKVSNQKMGTLRNSISNTAEVAERINKLLVAMGFHRFSLTNVDESNGGYRIVREDGTQAFESLSEGEKSFICFAYFWESLFGSAVASGAPENVVAVIDDPISSLDSDALFMIAAYIRDAAKRATKGDTNLRQLIVLTHNTQFHHEAAYTSARSPKDRRYFRLVKDLSGLTTVRDDENRSKIRGSYALLWHSVVEAARVEDESDLVRVGVFNIVRRILEGYFKTIGDVKDFERPSNVSPTEERMVSQFHVWANSGSHTIADDIDQTIDVGRTKDFLRQFQQFFDIQGHGAHFNMMVAASEGADLLEPGKLFARL
ncbi:AAA family ATPase [Brevibacterium sp. UCMA 11752]|uniref:AAA family ATPase n=1 Tax=Brevibacterium sp. UCMA 11752 TaxID=2745946 RepID=UPI001F35B266|nr:AAA family ATPase [Brevibacterium sp. UCMA 11752]MCF2588522.1 AAA family ATPase [Brevibacterium sp. UCMA 11752]